MDCASHNLQQWAPKQLRVPAADCTTWLRGFPFPAFVYGFLVMSKKIAFVGTGTMGIGMAMNLLDEGFDLCVYNRTQSKAAALAERGARTASSPAEAADQADVIISIVGDDSSSRHVWCGSEGILEANVSPSAIGIESTTVSVPWVKELAQRVREKGMDFLDCPVTGGPGGAQQGTLTLLVGGEQAVLDRVRDVLDCYAQEIIRFGPVGSGSAYKLIVNLIGATQIVAVAEGMLVAEKAGLDLEQVAYALAHGSVASRLVNYISERMAQNNHRVVNFAAKWQHKDADYAVQFAESLRQPQPLPMSRLARDLFAQAVGQGLGELNSSVVIEVLKGISNSSGANSTKE